MDDEHVPGRVLEAHVHADEERCLAVLERELTFTFGDEHAAAPPGTFVLVAPGAAVSS